MCFCTSTIVGTKFKVQSKRNKLGFQENNYEHQIPYQYSEIHCRAISTNGLLSLNIRSESPFFLPPVKKGRFGRLRQPCFFLPPVKKGGSGRLRQTSFCLPPVKKGGFGRLRQPYFLLPPVKKGGSGRLRQTSCCLPPVKKSGFGWLRQPCFFLPPVKKGGSGSTSPHAAIANAIDSETFLC